MCYFAISLTCRLETTLCGENPPVTQYTGIPRDVELQQSPSSPRYDDFLIQKGPLHQILMHTVVVQHMVQVSWALFITFLKVSPH
jgi:hypothetical protein